MYHEITHFQEAEYEKYLNMQLNFQIYLWKNQQKLWQLNIDINIDSLQHMEYLDDGNQIPDVNMSEIGVKLIYSIYV